MLIQLFVRYKLIYLLNDCYNNFLDVLRNLDIKNDLDANFTKLAPKYFSYLDTDRSPSIASVLREKFLGNKPITEENFPGLISVRVFGYNELQAC